MGAGSRRYTCETHPRLTYWDDIAEQLVEKDEHDIRRNVFECFWNGRGIPDADVDTLTFCEETLRSANGVAAKTRLQFSRLSGTLHFGGKMLLSTNKTKFMSNIHDLLEGKVSADANHVFHQHEGKLAMDHHRVLRPDPKKPHGELKKSQPLLAFRAAFYTWMNKQSDNHDRQIAFLNPMTEPLGPHVPFAKLSREIRVLVKKWYKKNAESESKDQPEDREMFITRYTCFQLVLDKTLIECFADHNPDGKVSYILQKPKSGTQTFYTVCDIFVCGKVHSALKGDPVYYTGGTGGFIGLQRGPKSMFGGQVQYIDAAGMAAPTEAGVFTEISKSKYTSGCKREQTKMPAAMTLEWDADANSSSEVRDDENLELDDALGPVNIYLADGDGAEVTKKPLLNNIQITLMLEQRKERPVGSADADEPHEWIERKVIVCGAVSWKQPSGKTRVGYFFTKLTHNTVVKKKNAGVYRLSFAASLKSASGAGAGAGAKQLNIPRKEIVYNVLPHELHVCKVEGLKTIDVPDDLGSKLKEKNTFATIPEGGTFTPGAFQLGKQIFFVLQGYDKYGNRQCMKRQGPWTVQMKANPDDILFENQYNKCKFRKAEVAWCPPWPPDAKSKAKRRGDDLRDMSVTIIAIPMQPPRDIGSPCTTVQGTKFVIDVVLTRTPTPIAADAAGPGNDAFDLVVPVRLELQTGAPHSIQIRPGTLFHGLETSGGFDHCVDELQLPNPELVVLDMWGNPATPPTDDGWHFVWGQADSKSDKLKNLGTSVKYHRSWKAPLEGPDPSESTISGFQKLVTTKPREIDFLLGIMTSRTSNEMLPLPTKRVKIRFTPSKKVAEMEVLVQRPAVGVGDGGGGGGGGGEWTVLDGPLRVVANDPLPPLAFRVYDGSGNLMELADVYEQGWRFETTINGLEVDCKQAFVGTQGPLPTVTAGTRAPGNAGESVKHVINLRQVIKLDPKLSKKAKKAAAAKASGLAAGYSKGRKIEPVDVVIESVPGEPTKLNVEPIQQHASLLVPVAATAGLDIQLVDEQGNVAEWTGGGGSGRAGAGAGARAAGADDDTPTVSGANVDASKLKVSRKGGVVRLYNYVFTEIMGSTQLDVTWRGLTGSAHVYVAAGAPALLKWNATGGDGTASPTASPEGGGAAGGGGVRDARAIECFRNQPTASAITFRLCDAKGNQCDEEYSLYRNQRVIMSCAGLSLKRKGGGGQGPARVQSGEFKFAVKVELVPDSSTGKARMFVTLPTVTVDADHDCEVPMTFALEAEPITAAAPSKQSAAKRARTDGGLIRLEADPPISLKVSSDPDRPETLRCLQRQIKREDGRDGPGVWRPLPADRVITFTAGNDPDVEFGLQYLNRSGDAVPIGSLAQDSKFVLKIVGETSRFTQMIRNPSVDGAAAAAAADAATAIEGASGDGRPLGDKPSIGGAGAGAGRTTHVFSLIPDTGAKGVIKTLAGRYSASFTLQDKARGIALTEEGITIAIKPAAPHMLRCVKDRKVLKTDIAETVTSNDGRRRQICETSVPCHHFVHTLWCSCGANALSLLFTNPCSASFQPFAASAFNRCSVSFPPFAASAFKPCSVSFQPFAASAFNPCSVSFQPFAASAFKPCSASFQPFAASAFKPCSVSF
jgi:hypothetical protein